ncbi:alkene reductase [Parasphingopyxis marina]|uniref:alkene reductase n=1 Tax=Parasphingopyxis marina TaxID=2761622 RepID=UPI0038B2FC75
MLSEGRVGGFAVRNRIVMAPLTRARSPDTVPNALNVEYYRQRAGAGMIISEATAICLQGTGAYKGPGLYDERQVAGWQNVTSAVHAQGGLIIAQLWHAGRMAHPDFLPDGLWPVSSSAITADAIVATPNGRQHLVKPRQLEAAEIEEIPGRYAAAAKAAVDAGFDGVELHGANGYLIDQFLRSCANERTDGWGGTIAKRCRFLFEVAAAVAAVAGPQKTGVRLSPTSPIGDMQDENPLALYTHAVRGLDDLSIGYLHIVEGNTSGEPQAEDRILTQALRRSFKGDVIVNNGYDLDTAEDAIADGMATAVSFGRPFIANPDLPARARQGLPLAAVNRATLYIDGETGYTDYPAAGGATS